MNTEDVVTRPDTQTSPRTGLFRAKRQQSSSDVKATDSSTSPHVRSSDATASEFPLTGDDFRARGSAPIDPVVGPAEPDRSAAMSALLARNWWAIAIRGVASVVFGALALFMPGLTLASLVLLFAAYMVVDGGFSIAAGVRLARRGERWGLLALEGLADIAAGIIAFAWPGITVLAFVYLTAAWAVISGALMVGAAIRLHKSHGRAWLGLGGIVSVVFGVLLMVAPIAGALVLTWWLGVYALAFGVALLILAFRLRGRREPGYDNAAAFSSR